MRERCLQSLAILLAGLFSAERSRSNAPAPEFSGAEAERAAANDVQFARTKPSAN